MARHGFLLSAGAALLAVSLVACSDSNSPSSSSDELTNAQADSLAEVVTQDADELVAASEFNSTTAVVLRHHLRIIPHFIPGTPPCDPAISPDPLSNGDGDAIPDSARFDFTGCSFTRDPFDVSVNGNIDVIDPSPAVAEFAVRLVFNDFGRAWTNTQTSRTWSVIHDGTRQVSANADELDHSISNFLTGYTFPNGATATHVRNWTGHFDAEVPGSIELDSPLPTGDWSFASSSTWSKGARTWGLQTTTTTALRYDPVPSGSPIHRRAAHADRDPERGHRQCYNRLHRLRPVHRDPDCSHDLTRAFALRVVGPRAGHPSYFPAPLSDRARVYIPAPFQESIPRTWETV